jgi:putative transposase
MRLIEERDADLVPLATACEVLGVSRATLYRRRRPRGEQPERERRRATSPRRLDAAERARILDTLHRPEFADQPPAEVYATLLNCGIYIGSIRTFYRELAAAGEVRERRRQLTHQAHAKPSLTATAPNQVWTWDITKLATTKRGVFLYVYVIIDLFSRYVVGWLVASKECKHLAALLFAETIARHGVEPGLDVHSDRGSAMVSNTLAQLLASLGVSMSFSRPRISNDNPFIEAQFKTLKYQPDYPGRFENVPHARSWLEAFFGWHNDEHHHSGLALFTPAEVFHGRVEDVARVRQTALDAAYLVHPERFPNGPPRVRRPPSEVSINPLTSAEVTASRIDGRGVELVRDASPSPAPGHDDASPRPPNREAEPCGASPSPSTTRPRRTARGDATP